jgi:hypothetical protein
MAHFNWPITNKTFGALDTPLSRSSHSQNKSIDMLSWMALLYSLWEFNLGQTFWITLSTRVGKLPPWHYQLYESTNLTGYKTLKCELWVSTSVVRLSLGGFQCGSHIENWIFSFWVKTGLKTDFKVLTHVRTD